MRRQRAGPFQIKAAISACQMAEPAPDWPQILHLYTALLPMEPTPVVRVNHAAVLAQAGQTDAARSAYARAIALASNESDRRFLEARAARLGGAQTR